eukprot:scaffold13838_cov21-Tisochrysis_lutea.AAC.4
MQHFLSQRLLIRAGEGTFLAGTLAGAWKILPGRTQGTHHRCGSSSWCRPLGSAGSAGVCLVSGEEH